MNFKKVIVLGMLVITFTSVSSNTMAYAKDNNTINSKSNYNYELSYSNDNERIVNKLDRYVELDINSKQFTIKSLAYLELENKEIDTLKDSIDQSNKLINDEIISGKNIVANIENKTFKEQSRVKRSISTSKYWDWEICWWGKRLFLHNNLIEDLQDYSKTYTAATGDAAADAVYAAVKFGKFTGPGGALIASLVGYQAELFYDKVVNNNNGYSVYIDAFNGQIAPSDWKFYPSW